MTNDELEAIEREFRGVSEQREVCCTMCGEGWELRKVTDESYFNGTYRLHHHIVPWDYDYEGDEHDYTWSDPRPEVKLLIDEVRRLKKLVGE